MIYSSKTHLIPTRGNQLFSFLVPVDDIIWAVGIYRVSGHYFCVPCYKRNTETPIEKNPK